MIPTLISDITSTVAQQNYISTLNNNRCEAPLAQKIKSKKRRLKKRNDFLHKEALQKMIWRFLTEKHMPEEKLSHTLGITVKSLRQFCSKQPPLALIPKINLPLIKLYCLTKFHDQ